jgi:hypothetical protein
MPLWGFSCAADSLRRGHPEYRRYSADALWYEPC